MNTSVTPLVSIKCLVYNHEPFLRQCLDGFVMQRTNFPFHAIVHDDASTDNSAAIIREYAEKYPDIIKPIYQTENQYSKRDGTIRRLMNAACTGKYIAICEGDDYWTDPLKLQKQVDFMENHPDYSMCFHSVKKIWNTPDYSGEIFTDVEDRDYTGIENFIDCKSTTNSVLYRASVYESELYNEYCEELAKYPFSDTILWLYIAAHGKLRGMSDRMSVYNRHPQGISYSWSSSIPLFKKLIEFYERVPEVFGKEYARAAKYQIDCYMRNCIRLSLSRRRYFSAINFLLSFFVKTPVRATKYLVGKIFRIKSMLEPKF